MKLDKNMGLVFIEEETSPEENIVKNMKVHDDNSIFYVEFESALHSFGVMNRNSRMYEGDNVEENLKTERIQHYLSHGGWFGEQNHPTPKYKNQQLSSERIQDIDMGNTSHKMLNPHREGNLLVSTIQTDSGTSAGINLAKKMIQGLIPGFSCRAIACLNLKNGKPVVSVKKIITYDWVLYQSHREAEKLDRTQTKYVTKSVNTEVVNENSSNDIVIPLHEILSLTSQTDANTQIIMESFNLSDDSMVGFSKNKKHVILRDENNMIYCNISPETRKKVNDFFLSF